MQKKPLFQSCGGHEVYTQLDSEEVPRDLLHRPFNSSFDPWDCYWPQVELLEEMSQEAPNAILVLNIRPVDHWIRSVRDQQAKGGYSMLTRLRPCNITGLPRPPATDIDHRIAELRLFFHEHNQRVRSFAEARPSHTLVRIDIEASDAGSKLAQGIRPVLNISESCWGHKNENHHHRTTQMSQLD